MQKNHLPTVKFKLPTIKKEAEVLAIFLHPHSGGWAKNKYIFGRHPELGTQLVGVTDPERTYDVCYSYTKEFRSVHAKEFEKALATNERLWRPIEKPYLKTLREHFDIDFPTHRKVMSAYVSMVPIYPRWLKDWSFNVSYFVPERVREIACHEIQHFLYFKKWLQVFPDTKYEELNSPHLVWRLSELVDPVILNEHPEFKKLFSKKQETYKHFQKIRIDGWQPTTHLARMYRKHLKLDEPFETFLQDIWAFAQKHRKVLMAA
jgi:hypothetical protein